MYFFFFLPFFLSSPLTLNQHALLVVEVAAFLSTRPPGKNKNQEHPSLSLSFKTTSSSTPHDYPIPARV